MTRRARAGSDDVGEIVELLSSDGESTRTRGLHWLRELDALDALPARHLNQASLAESEMPPDETVREIVDALMDEVD